jgi:hypothetical protein
MIMVVIEVIWLLMDWVHGEMILQNWKHGWNG